MTFCKSEGDSFQESGAMSGTPLEMCRDAQPCPGNVQFVTHERVVPFGVSTTQDPP